MRRRRSPTTTLERRPRRPAARFLAGVMGLLVLLSAFGAIGCGDGDGTAPETGETPSASPTGSVSQNGPRLHFPVESVDLGQVPFNTVVSYSFTVTNVGDAAAEIQDVQVRMLEGC